MCRQHHQYKSIKSGTCIQGEGRSFYRLSEAIKVWWGGGMSGKRGQEWQNTEWRRFLQRWWCWAGDGLVVAWTWLRRTWAWNKGKLGASNPRYRSICNVWTWVQSCRRIILFAVWWPNYCLGSVCVCVSVCESFLVVLCLPEALGWHQSRKAKVLNVACCWLKEQLHSAVQLSVGSSVWYEFKG